MKSNAEIDVRLCLMTYMSTIQLLVLVALAQKVPLNSLDQDCYNVTTNDIIFQHCFSTFGDMTTQSEARSRCKEFGTNTRLVQIDDRMVEDVIFEWLKKRRYPKQSFWIDAQRNRLSNWTWLNNQIYNGDYTTTFYPYVLGFASIRVTMNGVVQIDQHFYDDREKNELICEFKQYRCSASRNIENKKCFKITGQQTWYNARNSCLALGGDLAMSPDIVKLLERPLRPSWLEMNKPYWIGLRNVYWKRISTNSEAVYTNWDDNSPFYSEDESCVVLDASSERWSTANCNEQKHFICHDTTILAALTKPSSRSTSLSMAATTTTTPTTKQTTTLKTTTTTTKLTTTTKIPTITATITSTAEPATTTTKFIPATTSTTSKTTMTTTTLAMPIPTLSTTTTTRSVLSTSQTTLTLFTADSNKDNRRGGVGSTLNPQIVLVVDSTTLSVVTVVMTVVVVLCAVIIAVVCLRHRKTQQYTANSIGSPTNRNGASRHTTAGRGIGQQTLHNVNIYQEMPVQRTFSRPATDPTPATTQQKIFTWNK